MWREITLLIIYSTRLIRLLGIRNNNKIGRDPNHNHENDLEEVIDTTKSKLGADGFTRTGGIVSILLAGILAESEHARKVNNNTHNNNEIVQASEIDSDSRSNYGSNCDMEYSDFVV